MGKISKFAYTILIMLLTASLMTAGFAFGFIKSSKEKFEKEAAALRDEKEKKLEEEIREDSEAINAAAKKVSSEDGELENKLEDIEVIYIDYYKKCDHTITSKINMFRYINGKFKEKLK